MAKVISVGYTDTIAVAKSLSIPDLDYTVDFTPKSTKDGVAIITNVTSPLDRPENIRFAYSEIANVYEGTKVDPGYLGTSKRGVSLLCQVTDIYSLTDDTDTAYRVDLPVSAHIVLRLPACEYITPDMAKALVVRTVSSMFGTGQVSSARIAALLRGSLLPSGM